MIGFIFGRGPRIPLELLLNAEGEVQFVDRGQLYTKAAQLAYSSSLARRGGARCEP
jgi:hypothetical protein